MRNFHGLATFYRWFIASQQLLLLIVSSKTPLNGPKRPMIALSCLRERLLRHLVLPDFDKAFEFDCNASSLDLGELQTKKSNRLLSLGKS